MTTESWLLFAALTAGCVYIDAWRRGLRLSGLLWAGGAAFLAVVFVPLWYAKRPLRPFETRLGGFAANAWYGFSVIWASGVTWTAVLSLVEGRIIFAIAFWLVMMFLSSLVIVPVSTFLTKDVAESGTVERSPRTRLGGWLASPREAYSQRAGRRRRETAVLEALWAIETSGEIPGLGLVKNQVLALVSAERDAIGTPASEDVDPKGLAYLAIRNASYQELSSGRHHIHRGILSFVGSELLSSFIVASERMVSHGLQTSARHEVAVANLRTELSEIG